MIVTVTPNPALDLTYHLESFSLGRSQRAAPPVVRAGGKGVNVARVLHDAGIASTVLAPVGGAPGRTFADELDAAGIAHTLLDVDAPTRSTLVFATPEETTNLNETGHALGFDDWARLTELVRHTLEGHENPVLVCSGSMPPQAPDDAVAQLVEVARTQGTACVVDTSGPNLLAAADAGADVLKPNNHELAAVLPGTDVLTASRTLAERSGGTVYASLGSAGMLRVTAAPHALHARLDRSLTGNTTGAGDAAVAAIAAHLADRATHDPEETLRAAVAWSAAAVLHPLAGSIADPAPLLEAVRVTTTTTPPDLED